MILNSSEELLKIRNLTVDLPKTADRKHAVENVSLDVGHNEVLCLVGESGSGKSITGRAVMGLLGRTKLKVSSGEINFLGENLLKASDKRMRALRGSQIAMVFQEPMTALNPLMTMGRQLDELLKIHTKLDRAARKIKILELFRDVHLPDPERIYAAYPHEVSGGQRQRVVISMALILDPQLIIADEPTTALDVTTQAQILKLMKNLQSSRQTGLLFVTHDFGVVAEIADRVAVMQRGCLVETGSAQEVLNNPRHPYTQALIRAVPRFAPRAKLDMVNHEFVLSVKALDKVYGNSTQAVAAVKKVSFDLRRGETIGIVGESGSGKSTLARCIIRLIEPTGGQVMLKGIDFSGLPRKELAPYRKTIQMVFQDPYSSLNPRLTVGQLVAQGPIVQGVAQAEAFDLAGQLLKLVGLDRNAINRYPHEFSGGQRQRIGIARALAMRPAVLVADEPVSALDVSVQAQVLALLDDIRKQFDLAMVFITHDLRVAAQICDRVAVMKFGEVVEEGPTADVFASPSHAYTRSLLDAVPGKSWERQRALNEQGI
ncbi:Glutathione import ATP-binding protein GsiA OS=Afipia felis OX=1035 GN=gsiA_2 PE=3 SV=1 [Afipia felis]